MCQKLLFFFVLMLYIHEGLRRALMKVKFKVTEATTGSEVSLQLRRTGKKLSKEILAAKSYSRQKRCIVIQKQSGSHGDSSEGGGEDDDYRRPTPRNPGPDRLRKADDNLVKKDFENIQPELLKYKTLPNRGKNEKYRFVNRFLRNFLN